MTVGKLIKQYLPSFCFQTALEVTTMLEMISDMENLTTDYVHILLCQLEREKLVEKRLVRNTNFPAPRRGYGYRKEYRLI